jgi:hypothetical protein
MAFSLKALQHEFHGGLIGPQLAYMGKEFFEAWQQLGGGHGIDADDGYITAEILGAYDKEGNAENHAAEYYGMQYVVGRLAQYVYLD